MSGFASLSAFLAMGGYARFVWPAYGLTAAVMIGLLVVALRTLHHREVRLKHLRAERRGGDRP